MADPVESAASRQDILKSRRAARSPEESRTSAVGRKRKLTVGQQLLANGSRPDIAEKRPRLEDNADYVAFGDSDDGDAGSRRDSKESGEITTSASGDSRRGSNASRDIPSRPTAPEPVQMNSRVTPFSDDGEDAGPLELSIPESALSELRTAFKKLIQHDMKTQNISITRAVSKYCGNGMPYRKAASAFIKSWSGKLAKVERKPQAKQPPPPKLAKAQKQTLADAGHSLRPRRKSEMSASAHSAGTRPNDEPDSVSDEAADAEMDTSDDESGGGASLNQHDYGNLARSAAADHDNYPMTMLTLADISNDDQQLQLRYFNLTNSVAYVHCLSCGEEGHMEDTCLTKTCRHCGAVDQHFESACPAYRKCTHCRERGHEARICENRAVEGGGAGDPCDVCGLNGHVEEECTGLWRTFTVDASKIVKVPGYAIRKACYNCGSSSHWGDDCPRLPAYVLRKAGGKGTWSAQNASRYFEEESVQPVNHGGYGSRGYQHPQAYQLAQFDGAGD